MISRLEGALQGRVEPAEGGLALYFRHELAPEQPITVFDDSHQAAVCLDLLNLRLAADQNLTAAALAGKLHNPLEEFANILPHLLQEDWASVLANMRFPPAAAEDHGSDTAPDAGAPSCANAPSSQRHAELRGGGEAGSGTGDSGSGGAADGAAVQTAQQAAAGGAPAAAPARPNSAQGARQRTLDGFVTRLVPESPLPQQHGLEAAEVTPPQQQQQPEQQQPEQPEQQVQQQQPAQQQPEQEQQTSGGRTKRRRLSEAERLKPFAWDSRNDEHPYNEELLKPRSSGGRVPKRNRGLRGEEPPATAAAGASRGESRQQQLPVQGRVGDRGQAAILTAAAAEEAVAPAADVLLVQSPCGAAGAPAAPVAPATKGLGGRVKQEVQQGNEASGPTDLLKGDEPSHVACLGEEAQLHEHRPSQQPAQQPAQQQLQQQQQAEEQQSPLGGKAAAALGFGAAWAALRRGIEASAAAAVEREMSQLLAPMAQGGGAAAAAADRYAAVFCSVLALHQQQQHLARLRREAGCDTQRAAGGTAAVRAAAAAGAAPLAAWVRHTLEVLQLPLGL